MLASLFVLIGCFLQEVCQGEGAEKKTLNRAGSCDKERGMKKKRNYHIGRPGALLAGAGMYFYPDISNMCLPGSGGVRYQGVSKGTRELSKTQEAGNACKG